VSRLDGELELKAAAGRRLEVITGGGGRRRWSEDEKARAIEASLAPGVVVSEVARRHGISPQQLFAWRREARRRFEASTDAPPFAPAVVEAADGERVSLPAARTAAQAEAKSPDARAAATRKRRANRGALPAHLPRIETIVDIESEACPCCPGSSTADWKR